MDEEWNVRGKTVVVTGSTSGIGRETALALAGKGANVILAVRNQVAGQETADMIRRVHPGANVDVGPKLELAQPSSIRSFAAQYQKQNRPLHVLVNNAGANYLSEGVSEDGVPLLTQVNYLGPYMLTRLLEGSLVASAPSRVINVSSVMHRYGLIDNPASFLSRSATGVGGQYPATKLGNVLFTYELQRRLGHLGVQACAVDPGSVSTNIYKDSRMFNRQPLKWLIENLYAPPWDGASAVVHAASAPWRRQPKRKGLLGRRRKFLLPQKTSGGDTWVSQPEGVLYCAQVKYRARVISTDLATGSDDASVTPVHTKGGNVANKFECCVCSSLRGASLLGRPSPASEGSRGVSLGI